MIVRYALPRSYNHPINHSHHLYSRHATTDRSLDHGSANGTFKWTSDFPSDFPHGRYDTIWEAGNAALLVLNRQIHQVAKRVLYGENTFTFEMFYQRVVFRHVVKTAYGHRRRNNSSGIMVRRSWDQPEKERAYDEVVVQFGPRLRPSKPYYFKLRRHTVNRTIFSRVPGFKSIRFASLSWDLVIDRPFGAQNPFATFAALFKRVSFTCLLLQPEMGFPNFNGQTLEGAFTVPQALEAISHLEILRSRQLVVQGEIMWV
jgi:hypothetical protein